MSLCDDTIMSSYQDDIKYIQVQIERLQEQVNEMHELLLTIAQQTGKMDKHVDFIDGVYDCVAPRINSLCSLPFKSSSSDENLLK